MEGTLTGENGVGIGKQPYLRKELGEDVISIMRDIKQLLDPDNLMNPGKVVPA
jgi:D-lactate dehydrogenase (cytochrome)